MSSRRADPAPRRRHCGSIAVLVVLGVAWLGVTSTTSADAAGRPGDAAIVSNATSLPVTAPARAIPRLLATTEALPEQDAGELRTALASADALLGPTPPSRDAEADQATVAALGSPTGSAAASEAKRTALQARTLAGTLVKAALTAPAAQSGRLLAAAEQLDDASTATLTAQHATVPSDTGVAATLKAAGAPDGLAAANQDDSFPQDLAAAEKGATCSASGSANGTGTGTGTGSTPVRIEAGPTEDAADPLSGLARFPSASARVTAARADTLHTAGAQLGTLAYATRVVAQRAGSEALRSRADELDALVRTFQDAAPQGCAPLVTTTAGATDKLTSNGVDTLVTARLALADRYREAAAATDGHTRLVLTGLWWSEHSR